MLQDSLGHTRHRLLLRRLDHLDFEGTRSTLSTSTLPVAIARTLRSTFLHNSIHTALITPGTSAHSMDTLFCAPRDRTTLALLPYCYRVAFSWAHLCELWSW